jgi:SAM-dependent methyltransferase
MVRSKGEEKKFHNDEDEFIKNRQWVESLKPNLVFHPIQYGWNLLKRHGYKSILDYGCGYGLSTEALLDNTPDLLVGIDLSIVRIKECKEKFCRGPERFLVGDGETLCFKDKTFDCIFGNAILHHISIPRSIGEINRLLKPSGRAVFIEPLGHNPFISLIRKLTPRARTASEKPLTMDDIAELRNGFAGKVTIHFFFFSILLFLPLYRLGSKKIRAQLINLTDVFDRYLFKMFPFLRKFSWIAVIEVSK